jgi:hypothetical protein
MQLVRSLLSPMIAVLLLASPVLAQNGLQRFERDVKPHLEFEAFTYRGASPLGANGFVLNDVTAIVPAPPQSAEKSSTVKVDRVIVEEFDFDRVPPKRATDVPKSERNDDVPRFARIKLEGISGDDNLQTWLTRYGVPRTPVDAALDYRLDPATKVLTINKAEIALRGLMRIDLGAVLDGISDKASKLEGSKDDGRLRTGSLTIDDKGLLAQLLPAMARASGGSAEAWIAIVQASIQGYAADQGPETLKALDAVASFVADWRAPKGPISFTVRPASKVGVGDFDKLLEPNALTDQFGLTVSYDGTRPGASGGTGGAPPSTRAPRRPSPSQDNQREANRLTGKAAWDTVVGNTITGRIGSKAFHEYYRPNGTLATLYDGEIKPGKWAVEDDKVCVHRDGHPRVCYEVVASGRTITMTDAQGRGLRSTLLRGNPRDL